MKTKKPRKHPKKSVKGPPKSKRWWVDYCGKLTKMFQQANAQSQQLDRQLGKMIKRFWYAVGVNILTVGIMIGMFLAGWL